MSAGDVDKWLFGRFGRQTGGRSDTRALEALWDAQRSVLEDPRPRTFRPGALSKALDPRIPPGHVGIEDPVTGSFKVTPLEDLRFENGSTFRTISAAEDDDE